MAEHDEGNGGDEREKRRQDEHDRHPEREKPEEPDEGEEAEPDVVFGFDGEDKKRGEEAEGGRGVVWPYKADEQAEE